MELNDVNPNNSKKPGELPVTDSPLAELFESQLKAMLWAETALTHALPDMIQKAYSQGLKEALATHLEETKKQVEKVKNVFALIGKEAIDKKCEAMAGLLLAGQMAMLETALGAQRDAGIIASAQKVEHYEIASYGSLTAFAKTLGFEEAALLLGGILEEEKNADMLLNELALSEVNSKALTDL